MKKIVSAILVLLLCLPCPLALAAELEESGLADTPPVSQETAAVTLAARIHSVYGGGEGSFPAGTPWYQPALDYALANGIVAQGQYEDYGAAATRRSFAAIMAKALPIEALLGMNTVADGAIPDVPMTDPGAWGIYTLYRAGVLTGNDAQGTYTPNSVISRASAAILITRLVDPSLRRSITLAQPAPAPLPETPEPAAPAVPETPAEPEQPAYSSTGYYTDWPQAPDFGSVAKVGPAKVESYSSITEYYYKVGTFEPSALDTYLSKVESLGYRISNSYKKDGNPQLVYSKGKDRAYTLVVGVRGEYLMVAPGREPF